jgi:hypothetical protein
MLTVSPMLAGGIGSNCVALKLLPKKITATAFYECNSVRQELVAWYERLGYYKLAKTLAS